MRKLVALLVSIVLVLSSVSVMAAYNDHTDYVDWPLVTDGSLTVSVTTSRNETYGVDAKDMWFWQWSEQSSGIKFDVEQIPESSIDEKKSLMFASGELADLMFLIPLTDSEIIRYGVTEGLLLDLTPYITPEIMPHLCAWNAIHPEGIANATATDGAIYSFPSYTDLYILNLTNGSMSVNTDYLTEAGYIYGDEPKTLDEFTEFLYKIKAKYPDLNPLGGSYDYSNPIPNLMNANGFVWAFSGSGIRPESSLGVVPAEMYTGEEKEFVLPVTTDRYKEVVELMHQYYVDGIIDPEFYTIGETQIQANLESKKYAAEGEVNWQFMTDTSKFHEWTILTPLTSKYMTSPKVGSENKFNYGAVYLSADVSPEKAETICRYLDFFYSDLGGMYMWCGPSATSADCIGLTGGYSADETGAATWHDKDGNVIEGVAFMRGQAGGSSDWFGNRSSPAEDGETFALGVTNRPEMRNWYYDQSLVPYGYDPDWGNGWCYRTMLQKVEPYRIDSTPYIYSFDEETTLALDDLHMVIDRTVESEIAKFVTGKRDLAEWDSFQAELKAMGIEEMYEYYKTAYDAYKASTAK